MSFPVPFSIHRLDKTDVALMEAMLATFGEAFEDAETYGGARPGAAYLGHLLGSDNFIAIAALKNDKVVARDSNRSRHGWLVTGHQSPNSRPFRLQGLSPFFKLRLGSSTFD
jgi:hypothetical protein